MKNLREKLWLIVATVLVTLLLTGVYANLRNANEFQAYEIGAIPPANDIRFGKIVGDLLDPAFVAGNQVDTLLNGAQIFPAMLEAIRAARHTITFESYIYWSGNTGKLFADALASKAREGVKVHLLLDWAGSGKMDAELIGRMEAAGVEVKRYHEPRWFSITRMNHRTHRKILVIDGKVGFTGGVGIADEWTEYGLDPAHWRDTHYRVRGPVVAQMQSAFMDNWLKVQGKVLLGDGYFPELSPAGKSPAQMFISGSDEGGSSVRILYLMAIAAARKSIHLESAYFVPDEHTVKQLVLARRRGVEIHLLLPGPYTDSSVVDQASRETWGDLLREGVKISLYQAALFHCKVMVVDRAFVSVGSTNFDERSFRLNDEANLNVLDPAFAEKQLSDFDADLSHSKPFTFDEWEKRPLTEKLWGKAVSLVSSQL
jgi:cardiolipin synthase